MRLGLRLSRCAAARLDDEHGALDDEDVVRETKERRRATGREASGTLAVAEQRCRGCACPHHGHLIALFSAPLSRARHRSLSLLLLFSLHMVALPFCRHHHHQQRQHTRRHRPGSKPWLFSQSSYSDSAVAATMPAFCNCSLLYSVRESVHSCTSIASDVPSSR